MTPQWFGDYEIVKRLRVGGMATLYLARRHGAAGFSRLVALKMIHPNLAAQQGFVEMFVDEARICSLISHPNVVHVEEFGVIDGVHYLVMEYLDGCSVGELLQVLREDDRALDPELAARLIGQIAGGLHAAHETRDQHGRLLEIIHRDISPSNLLISAAGNAKLIDFGVAKARNRLSETESGGSLKGKYRYMAPEQGLGAAVDRRCDVFSLGIVFWELLTRRPLFPDDSAPALFHRLHRTEVVAPSAIDARVPAALDDIVLAMLQHDPDRRPATAAEVQRRIGLAAPGAANREAAELGALATDVRNRRAERARTEASDQDSHISFSPTPRSSRSRAQRSDESSQGAGERVPTTDARRSLRWVRGVLIALVGALACGAIGGAWIGLRWPDASAVAAPEQAPGPPGAPKVTPSSDPSYAIAPMPSGTTAGPSPREVRHAIAPIPRGGTGESPHAIPPMPSGTNAAPGESPHAIAPMPSGTTAVPSPGESPHAIPPMPSGTNAGVSDEPLPHAIAPMPSGTNAMPAGEQAPQAFAIVTEAPPAVAPTRRAQAHGGARPRPARSASDAEAARAPAPRKLKLVNGRAPFIDAPFDEADSESVGAGEPSPVKVKVKKTPIVPGFDN